MSDSTSQLALIQTSQGQKEVTANALFDAASPAMMYAIKTLVGTTLTYYGGRFSSTLIAVGSVTLTVSATNYMVAAKSNGAVSASTATTNWNDSANYMRLYLVVMGASTYTSYEDHRQTYLGASFTGGTLSSALNEAPIVTLASAATVNIGAAAANSINISGTTTITAFDSIAGGARRLLKFDGALVLTHNATSLILPGSANINTAAGDVAQFLSLGAGNWRCVDYMRANGTPLVAGSASSDEPVNAQTGTTYTYVTGDKGNLVTHSNAAAIAGTLPQAGASFPSGWWMDVQNRGAGTLTITPTTSTIDGAASLALTTGQGVRVVSDGTNYYTQRGMASVGGGSSTQGKHAIYVAAGSMRPSVTGGCNALTAIASAANQPDIVTLDFDTTTQEYAQFSVVMPKKWNEGTVTFKAHWSHAATTTNFGVAWDLQGVAVSDDDAIAVAYGTAVVVTDTGGTTNDLYTTAESGAITIAGTPQPEDMVFFRLSRVTADAGDTMAIDARLHGITLYVTTHAETDA